jgi:hypothetical protein
MGKASMPHATDAMIPEVEDEYEKNGSSKTNI